MKGAVAILVVLGVVAALCATVLVSVLMGTLRQAEPAEAGVPERAEFVVAAMDLPAMRVVRQGDLATVDLPVSEAPPDAMRNTMSAVGKVLASPMASGQPFTPARFVSEGTGMHLAAALPDGKRAVNISLADHSGLEGLLYPGSVVDVYLAIAAPSDETNPGRGAEVVSTTLFESIQVLGVNYQTIVSAEEEAASTGRANRGLRVTLLVDPDQAKALQLAMRHGTISLAMRNPRDEQVTPERVVSLYDLVGRDRAPALDAQALQTMQALEAMPPEPVAVAEPEPQIEAEPALEPVAARPPWQTTVIRGLDVQQKSFPTHEPADEPSVAHNDDEEGEGR
ncbi:MAG: Flp pilus assembly protein CpaB [Phycisphaeraceae bacterium]